MRTLYLHIGMPKAGSTSIQSAMRDAREVLEAEGVSYLRLGRNHSGVFRFLVGQTRKATRKPLSKITLDELGLAAPDRAVVLERVAAIARSSQATAVISGEGFFAFTPAEVALAKAMLAPHFDQIRVVAYLRDPLSWSSSRAQQAVKTGRATESEMIEEMERRGRAALIVPSYRQLESYVDAFGREAVLVRPFDRSAFADGDLLSDFLTTIGRPDLSGQVSSRVSNPSLSQEAVQLLCAFQAVRSRGSPLDSRAADRLRRKLAAIPGQTYRLPTPVLQKVLDLARDDLDWVRREFGLDLCRGDPRLPEPRSALDQRAAESLAELVVSLARKPLFAPKKSHGGRARRKRPFGLLARLGRTLGLSKRSGKRT